MIWRLKLCIFCLSRAAMAPIVTSDYIEGHDVLVFIHGEQRAVVSVRQHGESLSSYSHA